MLRLLCLWGWLCCLLLVSCGEVQWGNGGPIDPSGACDPALEPRIKGTIFWTETFGKEGVFRARGCLRISWGESDDEGAAAVVEVHRDGRVLAYNPKSGRFDGEVSFQVPASARDQARGFWLFVFGSRIQDLDTQRAYCQQTMSIPSYRCDDSTPSICIFSWVFRPKTTSGVSTKPIGDDALTCRLLTRSFVSEGPTAPDTTDASQESTSEARSDSTSEPVKELPGKPDAGEPGSSERANDTISQERTPEPGRDGSAPDQGPIPVASMGWCDEDKAGTPIDDKFFKPCAKDFVCIRNKCFPLCRLFPPKACPSNTSCAVISQEGYCYKSCNADDDFKVNYNANCALGLVCEGAFVNPSVSSGDHCGPSPYYKGYATGTRLLGEACTKDDGCDGTQGFFCHIAKNGGSCQQACDPRPGSVYLCPAGKSCVPDHTSFLQGRCE